MEIRINIEAVGLAAAIQSLADAIVAAGCVPVHTAMLNSSIPNAELTKMVELPSAQMNAPVQTYAPPQQPVQVQALTAPPMQSPQQYAPPAGVPTQTSAQQPPAQMQPPMAPQSTVPTTTQTYSMEQLAVAATQLVDAGRRNDLLQLLASFNVQALTALPKEQYGNFATQLRAMGARI